MGNDGPQMFSNVAVHFESQFISDANKHTVLRESVPCGFDRRTSVGIKRKPVQIELLEHRDRRAFYHNSASGWV